MHRATFQCLSAVLGTADHSAAPPAHHGFPLPEVLRHGDSVLFRLLPEEPALGATIEVSGGSHWAAIPFNDQNGLQLVRAGAKVGKEWAAHITLGPGTGAFDGTTGYPIVFRAVTTGGKLRDTHGTGALRSE